MKKFIFLILLLNCCLAQNLYSQDHSDIPEEYLVDPEIAHRMAEIWNVDFIYAGGIDSYLRTHPKGARQVSILRIDEFEELYPDKKSRLILFSSSGRNVWEMHRKLTEKGYERVYVVNGGLNTWQREGLPVVRGNEVSFREKRFKFNGFSEDNLTVYLQNGNQWEPYSVFVAPTVRLYLEYMGENLSRYARDRDIFDRLHGFMMNLQTPVVKEDKIWFGISTYNGEGFVGYGGLGFFEPESNQFGILRHPALVGCSTIQVHVEDEKIYAKTIGQYELSASLCNGVVELDLQTMQAVSLYPPVNSSLLWHKDEAPQPAEKYYDRSIREIITDDRFEKRDNLPGWNDEERALVREKGIEAFMKAEYRREVEARTAAVENAVVVLDSTFTIDNFEDAVTVRHGWGYGVRFWDPQPFTRTIDHLDTGAVLRISSPGAEEISIYPSYPAYVEEFENRRGFEPAEVGKRWRFETEMYLIDLQLVDIGLDSLRSGDGRLPVFSEVMFHVKIGELRN